MQIAAIRDYVALLWGEYQGAKRQRRGAILDELGRNLRIHRKSATRLMNSEQAPLLRRGKGSGGRKLYSQPARAALKIAWKDMGYLGAARLKAALPEWLPFFESDLCDDRVRAEMLRMSKNTLERILQGDKAVLLRRLNTGTKRGKSHHQTAVPIKNFTVLPTLPGHCEVDCVAHCGGSMSGTFAWTVTLTDIASGHTECEAMWGKNGMGVRLALTLIEKRLPFAILSLYFDNGSEFLNDQVIDLFAKDVKRKTPIEVFRGRPYHSNDQPHVEQKNYTHVRATFGYGRLDFKLAVQLMNNVYRKEWRDLQNDFYPKMKLLKKTRIGSKIRRVMSKPLTPYARLMVSMEVTEEVKKDLTARHLLFNPFQLRKKLRKKLRDFNLYQRDPGQNIGKYAI